MDEKEKAVKLARYSELCAKDDAGAELTDAEAAERTQLFFELNPDEQWWLSETDQRTPQDIWHAY